MTLFKAGSFTSHSGAVLEWKIDCDFLTDADLDCLAALVAPKLEFGLVYGIPSGGLRLAKALNPYRKPGQGFPVLIVDDVLTTGWSMEQARPMFPEPMGLVIFSRMAPDEKPPWIRVLFQLDSPFCEGNV